ncbi:MAG: ATP-binding protein [Polaromonas sp.]|nr:ATP-binding protein [Polaromonas sp.]
MDDQGSQGSLCQVHKTARTKAGSRWLCVACLAERAEPLRARVDIAKTRSVQATRDHTWQVGIPVRFAGLDFHSIGPSTPRNEQVVAAMKSLCANFEAKRRQIPGLFFIGPPGCGKTHLASVMANELQKSGHRPAYRSLPSLLQDFRDSQRKSEGVQGLMRHLVEADLLILDEIDLHGQSDHDYTLVFDLINRRYEHPGRPTLCISNRSLEHLQADLDERITSRVLGARKPINWDACNHRAKAPA